MYYCFRMRCCGEVNWASFACWVVEKLFHCLAHFRRLFFRLYAYELHCAFVHWFLVCAISISFFAEVRSLRWRGKLCVNDAFRTCLSVKFILLFLSSADYMGCTVVTQVYLLYVTYPCMLSMYVYCWLALQLIWVRSPSVFVVAFQI